MCLNDYGIKRKVISTWNLKVNAIVEHAYQILGNLIRSFQLQHKPYYDPDDPWGGILMAVAFALWSMYHTTLQVTPGQLIYGRDMVLNVQHLTDWTVIKAHKQQIICKSNQMEKSKWIPHHYQVGDLVMLKNHRANKYEQPYSRPYHITQVNMNGTVHLKINAVMDTINISIVSIHSRLPISIEGKCNMHRAKDRWV
jgi:hypothetical protein